MIRFYFKDDDISLSNTYHTSDFILFSDEFIEWCNDLDVFFKSVIYDNNEDVLMHVRDMDMRTYNMTSSVDDSLYMDEETAVMFKLAWL